ncbi:MAG: M23 family metallopeptidase [Dehalococcoidia bacterium]
MPGAVRAYRHGTHEGIDFYQVDNCTKIGKGTPVRSARDGTVIRADTAYVDLTQAELAAADKKIAAGQANDPALIDLFRGRQVWVDHGNGIVTRYAHLSAIPPAITVGRKVVQGQTIAFVGDSGTPESIADPTSEMHLHFEVRTGDSYLGKGLPPAQVRTLYTNLFAPWPPS